MNEMFSQGGKGSTGILTNKQAIARKFGVKQNEVVYFAVGVDLSGYKVIYDKETQRAYSLPADIAPGTTAISLSTAAVLVHSSGSVDLGELAVSREEYVTLPWSFDTGATLNVKNELLTHTTGKYRWDGEFPKTVPAGSTPVTTGGISASNWLPIRDITLRSELASHDAGKGDAFVVVKQPFTGAVGMTQHDKNKQLVHVADFGAVADGATDASPGINAAVAWLKANGGGTLYFGVGTYLCNSAIDLKGAYVCLHGSGMTSTTIKAGFSGDALIDLYETSDVRIAPITISDMVISGNSTVARTVSLRYRHYTKFQNVIFEGGGSAAFYAKDAWLNAFDNCGFESSPFGCHLDGSNHRTRMDSCSFQGCTTSCLAVRSNGTANDGNSALMFNNCDFEFSEAAGVDFLGTDATFNCCYVGENLTNSVFLVYGGNIRVNGGVMAFGYTENTYLAYLNGGTIIFQGSVINGQTHAAIGTLGVSSGGKMALKECTTNIPTGQSMMAGDVLLSGICSHKVFAPRLGVDYASYTNNTTITDTPSGNQRTVTLVTAPGPSPVFGLRATLTDMQWRDGEKWYVIVTYSSNVDFILRVAATPLGEGTIIGTLPSTGGAVRTVVLASVAAVRTTATVIEIYRDSSMTTGDTFTLRDISFGDSRALGADFGGNYGNMYKF